MGTDDTVPVATGSAGGAGDPERHRDLDHDRRLHRLRHPADDADTASTQFSPRILLSFVRDRGTQWTLGVFLGTFSYCMAALPAARSLPVAFVPVLTVTGAMVLALVAVRWLIFFIHHISQAISVNHIVDRIARETELVIDGLMPRPRTRFVAMSRVPMDDTGQTEILNQHSG
jgi:uncharacterized membrane protein